MKSPNIQLPNEELRQALYTRLNGNILRNDDVTVLPIYDQIPEDFGQFDFLEIGEMEVAPLDDSLQGAYECSVTINVYSTYRGYRELSRELNQVHRYLGSELRSMTNFTDVSQGGDFISVQEMKKESEDGKLVRHGVYVRRWTIADNRR